MLVTDLNKNGNLRKREGKAVYSAEVKEWQILLKSIGYDIGRFGADGKFGKDTENATKKFQKDHVLTADGIVGNLTLYEAMWYRYPHFKKSEFKCKCGGKFCNGYPVRVDEKLLVLLEKIRAEAGNVPVIINSGIRCKKHNASKDVKGEPNSQHLFGTAADINISNMNGSQEYTLGNRLNPNGGVGKYKNFVHVDTRGRRARW